MSALQTGKKSLQQLKNPSLLTPQQTLFIILIIKAYLIMVSQSCTNMVLLQAMQLNLNEHQYSSNFKMYPKNENNFPKLLVVIMPSKGCLSSHTIFISISHFEFQSIPTQDCQDEDISKSEIYCPLINHNKSTNEEVLSSLLLCPLSIHYANKKEKNGERIYLEKFRSVTSILSQTKPPSEWFALKNWKKAQISELGDEEFKEMKKTISRKGTLFHHVSLINY